MNFWCQKIFDKNVLELDHYVIFFKKIVSFKNQQQDDDSHFVGCRTCDR